MLVRHASSNPARREAQRAHFYPYNFRRVRKVHLDDELSKTESFFASGDIKLVNHIIESPTLAPWCASFLFYIVVSPSFCIFSFTLNVVLERA